MLRYPLSKASNPPPCSSRNWTQRLGVETTHLAQGHLGRHSQASLFAAGGLRGCDELMSMRWPGRAAYWPECPLPPRGTPVFPGGLVSADRGVSQSILHFISLEYFSLVVSFRDVFPFQECSLMSDLHKRSRTS